MSFITTPSAGGGATATSISEFDKTVGAGGDYATISAAVTAGYRRLRVIDNTTETGDIAVGTGMRIHIDMAKTVAMGTYQFTFSQAADVYITGDGQSSVLQYAHTSANIRLFANTSYATSRVILNNVYVDNNSTQSGCYLSEAQETLEDVTIDCPNVATCGNQALTGTNFYHNVTYVGGGSSCSGCFVQTANVATTFNGLMTTGTFSTTTAVFTFANGTYQNIIHGSSSAILTSFGANCIVNNIQMAGSFNWKITATGNYGKLSNINLGTGSGTSAIDLDTYTNWQISNFIVNTLDLSDTSASHHQFSGGEVTVAVTLAGDNNKLTGVFLVGGATVNDAADRNGFVNSQGGAYAGGGALTITDNATADQTIVVGCHTDAALGAGVGCVTNVAANVVY